MTGCATVKQNEIILPPKPEREELKEIKDIKDCAYALNYYEHLLQEWELWGDTVTEIVKKEK